MRHTPLGTELHPDCLVAVDETANLCAGLGHEVVEAAPSTDWETLWRSFTSMVASGTAWGIRDWARRTGREPDQEDFEPFVWEFAKRGRQMTAPDYLLVQRLSREVATLFDDYDLWLTPTLGQPPVPLDTLTYSGGDPFELRRRVADFSPFTYISNVTGQPAMSVPLHWSADGLPIGSHFGGRFGDEATLFRLAGQLESARPWRERRPPIG